MRTRRTAILPIPVGQIARAILLIRGQKVMLDSELANLYRVETRALNQAVKRNAGRFPPDFMFQLTHEEVERLVLRGPPGLRSQFVISNLRRGGRRYAPLAFTEQGVAMLSSVLRSQREMRVNVEIMRAFVKLRELLGSHKDLARKVAALEQRYDAQFKVVFDAIRQLMTPPAPKRPRIGFRARC